MPPRYRGKHQLSFTRCIGCGNCLKICPNDCMWLKKINDPELGKIERPGVDYARCLFCGLCVEICPTDAITMTGEYELSALDRKGLSFDPEDLRSDDFPIKEPKESTLVPELDFNKCKGTGECIKICPLKCIKMVEIEKTGRSKPEIDLSVCNSCGKCAEVCPEKAIEMKNKLIIMYERAMPLFDLSTCTGCGACSRACPADVIYLVEMPGTEKTKPDGTKTKPKKCAVFVLEKCVGCGRCVDSCKFNCLLMVPESEYEARKAEREGGKKE